ncbi:MAG: hypothetical protein WAR79_05705 [Melioribacteraceae bacterium]
MQLDTISTTVDRPVISGIKLSSVTYHDNSDYINYDESKTYDPRLFSLQRKDKRSLRALAELLFPEVINGAFKKKSQRIAGLENLLCNLLDGHESKKVIAIPMTPKNYPSLKQYKIVHYTYDIMKSLIYSMEYAGYLNVKKGFYFPDEDKIKRTRICASEKLVQLFRSGGYIKETFRQSHNNPIILKNRNKELINYKETNKISRMRRFINMFNAFMRKQEVTIPNMPDWTEPYVPEPSSFYYMNFLDKSYSNCSISMAGLVNFTMPINSSCQPSRLDTTVWNKDNNNHSFSTGQEVEKQRLVNNINTTLPRVSAADQELTLTGKDLISHIANLFGYKKLRTDLHRVFSNGSFSLGGRFYGAQYQNVKSKQRPYILINGNPTIEADYSAFHITMLYHMNNLKVPKDPYILNGQEFLRPAVKLLINTMINARSKESALTSFRNDLNGVVVKGNGKNSYVEIDDNLRKENELIKNQLENYYFRDPILALFNEILESHPLIEKYLCSGIGLKLQNIDSQIAENILKRLFKQKIPVLCNHDSFIVETHHQEALIASMDEEYSKIMNGFKCSIKIK